MGVQTVKLTEARGYLVGALVVRDGFQVMLISTGGTVIKMPVEDVKRLGRSTQGVIVMRLRDGETVSALAPVLDAAPEDEVRARREGLGRSARTSSSRPKSRATKTSRPKTTSRRPNRRLPYELQSAARATGSRDALPGPSRRAALSRRHRLRVSTASISTSRRSAGSRASRRCSSTTGRTRRRSRRRARSSGSTTWRGRARDADQAGPDKGLNLGDAIEAARASRRGRLGARLLLPISAGHRTQD